MVRAKLTDRAIQAVKPVDGTRIELHDEQIRGLVLRIAPSGKRTWSFVYRRRSDGLKRRMTLGPYPSITLEAVRRKAHEIVAAVWDGRDPVGEAKAVNARMSFGTLAALYLERHAHRKLRSAKKLEQHLNLHVLPRWRDQAAEDIKKGDVIALVEAVAAEGKGAMANRLRELISGVYGWAIDEDIMAANPAAGIRNRAITVVRERFLDEEEIRTLLSALDRGVMLDRAAAVLRLCILTAQRVGEVAGMTVSEVDTRTWLWTLPAERSKNRRPHTVPLVGQAKAIVAEWVEEASRERRRYLFQTTTGKPLAATHLGNYLTRSRDEIGLEDFTVHDLRRTAATHMSRMGIDRLTIAAVLNHASITKAGITGSVYDRHDRLDEKRRALEAWDAEVKRIVEGKAEEANVVPLRR